MKTILNLIRDLLAGKQGYHTESEYLKSVVHYTKTAIWQLGYILDIILDSKYVWDGKGLPGSGSVEVTQEEGKILQGVLMMHGHYWLDYDHGPYAFKCRKLHASIHEKYILQWYYDHALSWYSTDTKNSMFHFSDFEKAGILRLPEKYRGWKTGMTYGI